MYKYVLKIRYIKFIYSLHRPVIKSVQNKWKIYQVRGLTGWLVTRGGLKGLSTPSTFPANHSETLSVRQPHLSLTNYICLPVYFLT